LTRYRGMARTGTPLTRYRKAAQNIHILDSS
jgi:hypothetical protein